MWDIEISNDETHVRLICENADGTDDLFVVSFRRGWISVYSKYGEWLGWVGRLVRGNFYKGGISTEVKGKTAWYKFGLNIESDASSSSATLSVFSENIAIF